MKKLLSIMVVLVVMIFAVQDSFAAERYVVTFGMKQSRVSLDLWKHAKDSMNSAEFQMPVDKHFYDSLRVGQSLTEKFRTGSFVLYGSWSKWKIWVKKKHIVR